MRVPERKKPVRRVYLRNDRNYPQFRERGSPGGKSYYFFASDCPPQGRGDGEQSMHGAPLKSQSGNFRTEEGRNQACDANV